MFDEDIHRAAIILLKEHEYNQLYEAQQRAWNDLIVFTARALSFALVYWSLWPLFRRGHLRHWAEAKKRDLNSAADDIDERQKCARQACLDAGLQDGYIPRRSWLG